MRRLRKFSETWQAPTRLGARIPMISLIQSLAVAEYLDFRHAANALGVSQSSVSARIKVLEEDLGILLSKRHARGVRLTEAGRHFIEGVAAGIDHLDHAVKMAGALAQGDVGRIRLGVYWRNLIATSTASQRHRAGRIGLVATWTAERIGTLTNLVLKNLPHSLNDSSDRRRALQVAMHDEPDAA